MKQANYMICIKQLKLCVMWCTNGSLKSLFNISSLSVRSDGWVMQPKWLRSLHSSQDFMSSLGLIWDMMRHKICQWFGWFSRWIRPKLGPKYNKPKYFQNPRTSNVFCYHQQRLYQIGSLVGSHLEAAVTQLWHDQVYDNLLLSSSHLALLHGCSGSGVKPF